MMMNLKFIPKWWWANSYSTQFKELKQSKLSFSIDKQRFSPVLFRIRFERNEMTD